MNRSALNSVILGAGAQIPLTFASAFQALYLIAVTAKNSVIRRGIVDQRMVITGGPTPRITRFFNAVQKFALNYNSSVHQWINVYFAAVQNFAMTTGAIQTRILTLRSNTALYLNSQLRAIHQVAFQIASTFALSGSTYLRTAARAVIGGSVAVVGAIVPRTAARAIASGLLRLAYFDTSHHWVYNPVVLQRNLSLLPSLAAFDITTNPANDERTATVQFASREVVVPGEKYTSGV